MNFLLIPLLSLSVMVCFPEKDEKSMEGSIFFVKSVTKDENSNFFELDMMCLNADQAQKKAYWLRKAEVEKEIIEKGPDQSKFEEKTVGPFWMPNSYDRKKKLNILLVEAVAITGPKELIRVHVDEMPSDLSQQSFLVKEKVQEELIEGFSDERSVWRHNFWRLRVVYP